MTSRRRYTLTEIIAIADGINHDVPTEQEFTNSGADLIDADVHLLTARIRVFWRGQEHLSW
jgi:hypothetical protein